MELTLTPRSELASTCPVSNSPLAEAFISALAERFAIAVEAVYLQGELNSTEETILTLYVHFGRSRGFTLDNALKSRIFELFCEIAADSDKLADIQISTEEAKAHRNTVMIEYIDRLTLWHRLSASIKSLNRLPEVEALGAKLYCSFDQTGAPRPLALFYEAPVGARADEIADRLTHAIYAHLKPRDIRDAVTHESVRPMLSDYKSLTAEQRFALARE